MYEQQIEVMIIYVEQKGNCDSKLAENDRSWPFARNKQAIITIQYMDNKKSMVTEY